MYWSNTLAPKVDSSEETAAGRSGGRPKLLRRQSATAPEAPASKRGLTLAEHDGDSTAGDSTAGDAT